MSRFEGKIIVVLNADTEIGAAIAKRFIADGALVILNGFEELLRDLTRDADPQKYWWHAGDATEEAYLQRLFAEVRHRFGSIHAVVNLVQPVLAGYFLDNEVEHWSTVNKVGFRGVLMVAKLALPHLVATRGSITNVAVRFDDGRNTGGSAYDSTREAICTFTRSVARELASEGVRVNVVSPRLTGTAAVSIDLEERRPLFEPSRELIPVGRSAIPEEIASVVAFLVSADAAFVNGVELPLDGGFCGIGRF